MSHHSSVELLEYTRLTLQLIERYPHREEDAHLATELKFALGRYINDLERETSKSLQSLRTLRSPEPTGNV